VRKLSSFPRLSCFYFWAKQGSESQSLTPLCCTGSRLLGKPVSVLPKARQSALVTPAPAHLTGPGLIYPPNVMVGHNGPPVVPFRPPPASFHPGRGRGTLHTPGIAGRGAFAGVGSRPIYILLMVIAYGLSHMARSSIYHCVKGFTQFFFDRDLFVRRWDLKRIFWAAIRGHQSRCV
jgi:hypothetical protein